MHEPVAIHKALIDTTNAVTEYVGSEAYRHAAAMLEVLIYSYSKDLQNVLPEDLVRVQTAIRQTTAIRDLLIGASRVSPKI